MIVKLEMKTRFNFQYYISRSEAFHKNSAFLSQMGSSKFYVSLVHFMKTYSWIFNHVEL